MQRGPLQHNEALFDALYEHARTIEPKVTRGAMFGSPAIFVGRKMAACVFGNEVAFKIPAETTNVVVASRRATHFTPYGKPKMREWVSLAASESSLDNISDLLASALSYAKTTNS